MLLSTNNGKNDSNNVATIENTVITVPDALLISSYGNAIATITANAIGAPIKEIISFI